MSEKQARRLAELLTDRQRRDVLALAAVIRSLTEGEKQHNKTE